MQAQDIFLLIAPAVVAVSGVTWLIFVYWQIRLITRIHVVARTQHRVPENVFWLTRARLAITADPIAQKYQERRNYFAVAFLCTLGGVGVVVGIGALYAA